MREIRPTIKVLKMLPRETFGDPTPLDHILGKDFERLDLSQVDHPLLEDGRRRFSAGGAPGRHVQASQTWGRPVFEVRDHTGPGWRGAVILDDQESDPWLVWAERHDRFHDRVAEMDPNYLLPTPGEYKLRLREEAAAREPRWRRDVLEAFITTLRSAIQTGEPSRATLPGTSEGATATLCVETAHDEPSDEVAEAHHASSVVEVSLRIDCHGEGWQSFQQALIRTCLPLLEPDHSRLVPAYGRDGSLIIHVDITQAQVIQLLADPPPYVAGEPVNVRAPSELHYVGTGYLLDGLVNGGPVRAVCGVWFVASRSDSSGLPVCQRCEDERPAAQEVLDLLRARK